MNYNFTAALNLKIMKYIFTLFISVCVTIISFAQKTGKPVAKPVVKTYKKPVAGTATVTKNFANGITMNIKGFKVSDASLYFDDGNPVPEGNMVDLNQHVTMFVVIDSGYKIINGKVFPGGSERIVLSNGYEVLKADDLFTAYTAGGVDAKDGKYISLKAVITQIDDKQMEITVNFRIWDKKGPSNITGSYKLHIK